MKATALKNPEICIIGGFPRAGTRQVADVLNAHKNVRILSEVFAKAFRKAADMMEASDERHRNHRSEEPYYATRTLAVLNVLAVIQKKGYEPFTFDGLNVVGFKTPRIEVQKEGLDTLFPRKTSSSSTAAETWRIAFSRTSRCSAGRQSGM